MKLLFIFLWLSGIPPLRSIHDSKANSLYALAGIYGDGVRAAQEMQKHTGVIKLPILEE